MKKLYFPLAVLLCCAWAFFIHRDELRDKSVYYGDISGYYLLYGYADGSLLKKDYLMSYLRELKGSETVPLPRVLRPLEGWLTKRMDVREILLWKSILLQVLISVLAVLAFRERYGPGAAWAVPLFLVYFSTMDVFYGGLNRELAVAALLLLYLALLRNSGRLWALSLGLYALFYWVSLPFALCVCAAWRFRRRIFSGGASGPALYAAAAAAVILGGLYSLKLFFPDYMAAALRVFSWKDTYDRGAFSFLEVYLLNSYEFNVVYAWMTGCLAAAVAAGVLYGQRLLGEAEKPLALGLAAVFLPMAFFSPSLASRQVVHSLPFLLLLAFAGLLAGPRLKKLRWAAAAALLAAFLVYEGAASGLRRAHPGVVEYIKANTSVNDLIFAHPIEEPIPLYTRRPPYVWLMADSVVCANGSMEKCLEAGERLDTALKMHYSGSVEELADFIRSSGVDHFLVRDRHYSGDFSFIPPDEAELRRKSSEYFRSAPRHLLREAAVKFGARIDDGVYLLPAHTALEKLGSL